MTNYKIIYFVGDKEVTAFTHKIREVAESFGEAMVENNPTIKVQLHHCKDGKTVERFSLKLTEEK